MDKPDDKGKQSVWKKEITLRRKPNEQSVWKKEITIRRKPNEQSVWKKEITLRRKPKEQGHRVPAAPSQPAKPDSVAELLRPLAEQTLDPVVLPPVTPPVSSPTTVRPDLLGALAEETLDPVVLPPVTSPVSSPTVRPELLGALAEQTLDPVVLPPVTPPVSSPTLRPATPEQPEELQPEPPAEPELEAGVELEVEPPAPAQAPAPAPELPPSVQLPKLEPVPRKKPSRRERKAVEQAADRAAKAERRRTKHTAKEERHAVPAKHKRLVGLKVGGSQIAAVQVVNKGGPRVVRMARMQLERGIVVGGELREPDELAAALKTFFRKNKLPRTAVRLGISNNRIGVRTFEISGIDDPKQLANAIRYRAQEALPIPLDEAVLDYRILEDRVLEDGVRSRRVLLVVAHRELVDRYLAACRKAGLKLVGIDLEAFALLRALSDPARPPAAAEDAGLVCISIGHDRSTLAVSNGRVCEFTRVLAWGGSALDIALARVLDLSPSEAEPFKRALSLAGDGEAAGLDARQAELGRSAMSAELQAFARELVASLRFYQEQPESLGISEILVTGGSAECGGLTEELERLIGVTVRVADPLARVKVPRKLRKVAGSGRGSLAVALGLGIED